MKPAEPFFVLGEHLAIDLVPARPPGRGARAIFTTRHGGVSTGPYASLNLGRRTDDDDGAVRRNWELLAGQLGVRLAFGRQVHGSRVNVVTTALEPGAPPWEADGQATALSGVGTMVLTADCLPVAVAGDGAVAMLHAGWRGLQAGVIASGVRALRELGAEGPLHAAIGPGAGPCCYETGEDVHAVFAGHGPHVRVGRKLDLKAIARSQLERAGVAEVHDSGLCTICDELFYSHRRDRGVTGRQAGVAWLS